MYECAVESEELVESLYKFLEYCKNGNLPCAMKLYEELGINVYYENCLAFRYACSYGHFHVAKWLRHLQADNIDEMTDKEFEKVYENGGWKMVTWLTRCHYRINLPKEYRRVPSRL